MATSGFAFLIPQLVPFPVPRAVAGLLERALGFGQLAEIHDALRGHDLPARLLDALHVECVLSARDLENIPRNGPALITANHPFGILEGAVLANALTNVRRDVRFLANGMLGAVPEIRHLLIEVDPISGRGAGPHNSRGLRRALDHLMAGGLLVVFPAGEVSHFRWKERRVADRAWDARIARLIEIAARHGTRVPVVPTYIEGCNSALFHAAGMLHPGLRTALLGRELLNKRGRRVEIRTASPVPAEKLLAMTDDRERMDYLRWRTYLLDRRERFHPRTALPLPRHRSATPASVDVAAATPAAALAGDVAALPPASRLNRSGDLEVYLAPAHRIPHVLREIGRLREVTFRAAGEGSGKTLDLDEFDPHYLHLFVWNARSCEVVGAYRLAATDAAGPAGLYTAKLFAYDDAFLERLGPAVELGRSFVRREYQRAFAPLLLLWKGIGKYVAANPRYKVLFGPVSISNRYQAVSRDLMVRFLEHSSLLRDFAGLVRHRHQFRDRVLHRAHAPVFPRTGFDIEDLSGLVSDLEPDRAGVPVLLRQYLKLGGKLVGFNVDPDFANALDGLILVDLTRTGPRLLERYLGRAEAEAFLALRKGANLHA